MWDLIRMERELLQAIKIRDEWKVKGYDTPIITWGEQLEMYEDYALRVATEIEKILKEK